LTGVLTLWWTRLTGWLTWVSRPRFRRSWTICQSPIRNQIQRYGIAQAFIIIKETIWLLKHSKFLQQLNYYKDV
jgi:hypothetical protein